MKIIIECAMKNYIFELEHDYITLDAVRQYFPQAVGLKYHKNNKWHYVDLEREKFKLKSDVEEYKVYYTDELKEESFIDKIKEYFFKRYTYKEITQLLYKEPNIKLSTRTLCRILKDHELKRKNVIESSLEEIVTAIITEINDHGMNLGYRSLWQRLRDQYRLNVKQSTVLNILREIDPEGIEERSRYRLKRRRYRVLGPNYLWHIDGYDKLKKFGFAIHGCVDGFSRKVLWLKVSVTNNKPEVISYYYLQCLKELKLLPCIIRSDRGSENTLIDQLQIALRYYHEDENAGERSFIKGKSTANERIEKYWNHLRNHTMNFFIHLFKSMQDENILDIGNIIHVEILRFCFGPFIQYSLDISKREWNEHRVRKQNIVNLPSGIPNCIYEWPEKFGGQECKKEVDAENIETLLKEYTVEPVLYNPEIEEVIRLMIPNFQVPCSSEEAYNLFIKVIELLDLNQMNLES